MKEVLIFCVDGVKGFLEAIQSQFPHARVQIFIVHMVRGSLGYVNYKVMKAGAAVLRRIYCAATVEQAWAAAGALRGKVGKEAPHHRTQVAPELGTVVNVVRLPEIRRGIYTTNAVEAVNRRDLICDVGSFRSDGRRF